MLNQKVKTGLLLSRGLAIYVRCFTFLSAIEKKRWALEKRCGDALETYENFITRATGHFQKTIVASIIAVNSDHNKHYWLELYKS